MENKTLNFHLYRYHLLPIDSSSQQTDLFAENELSLNELKERKNEFFAQILDTLVESKSNTNPLKLEDSEDGVYLFKIAQRKAKTITKDFKSEVIADEPYVYVVINNDKGVQKIAISENPEAFSKPNVVSNILKKVFRKELKIFGLNIEIESIYNKGEFWQSVKKYKKQITYLNFEFIKPNLAQISKSLPDAFKKFAEETNSHESHIALKAPKNGVLDKVNEENETIRGLVDYTSEGAGNIKMKVKNIRKQINTKESPTIVEVNELEIEGAADQLIKIYKTITE